MIADKVEESRRKRGRALKVDGFTDVLAVFLATGFGVGFMPVGPGTWGSLVGLSIAYGLIYIISLDVVLLQSGLILVSVALAVIGIWAATRAEKCFDQKDSSQIVIDEVCGQLISFVFIAPYIARLGLQWRWWMIAGFVLFRLFDIFKPYPINQLQSLKGGLGVMMDDVIAGIYTAVILSFMLAIAT
jgi:phosphatidylglycerophosphatase A